MISHRASTPAAGSPGDHTTSERPGNAPRDSERRLCAIVETAPECVKIVSREGRLLEMNPAGLDMLQADSLAQAQQQPLLDYIVPEHRAAFVELHRKVMAGGSGSLKFEVVGLRGGRRWIETRAVPLRNDAHEVRELLGLTRDVTERELSERRAADEHRILELIAREAPLAPILNELCASLRSQLAAGTRCSILKLDDDGRHLRHIASSGLSAAYIRAIDGVATGLAAGSCGTATHLGGQVIVSDIATDPLWAKFRDLALQEGLGACWSSPILSDKDGVLGTFAVYHPRNHVPDARELALVGHASHLASIAISRELAEEARHADAEKLRQLIDGLGPGMFVGMVSIDGAVVEVNESALAVGNLKRQDVLGKPVEDTYWFSHSQEARTQIRSAVRLAAAGTPSRHDVRIQVAKGELLWVDLFLVPYFDARGRIANVIASATDINERKRAEQALGESEERFRQLAENIREVFWLTNADKSQMLYVSPAYEAIWGRSCSSLYAAPRTWLDAIHAQDRERVIEAAARQESGDYAVEYRIVRPDGSIRWIRDRAFPVRSADGRVYRIAGVAEDITGSKAAEQALRASELRKSAIIETALDCIITIDAAGKVVEFNPAAERTFGFPRAEAMDRNLDELIIPPVQREAHRRGMRHFQERGHGPILGRRMEIVAMRKDGTEFPAELTVVPIHLPDQTIFSSHIRDVTERRRAEESLRQSRENLAALINNVDGIVWEAEAETFRFTFVSPRAERLLGYPAARWTGEPAFWRDHIHPDDREQAVRYCAQCTGEKRDHEFEYRMLAADGRVVWLRDIVTVVVEAGRPAKLRGVMVDITAHKLAETALRESELHFRQMAEKSPDAILIHQEGRIVVVNEAMVRLMRARNPSDLVGRPATSVLDPGSMPPAEERIRRLYAGEKLGLAEQKYVRLDGTCVEVEVAAAPFLLEGRPAALVTVRDISVRKQAEQRQQESEVKYRALIEQASDGIFVIDAAGRFLLVNSPGCDLLGYSERELLGMHHELTYLDAERPAAGDRIEQARTGEVLRYERMVRRKDGSAFPAELSSRMLDNGSFQVIFRDITERRAQEEKIARLSRIHAVLSGINSAIVRIRERNELLEEACRIAVDHGGFSMGWISTLDPASGRLVPVARAGIALDGGGETWDSPKGLLPWGAAEAALRDMRPAFDNDIKANTASADDQARLDTARVRRAAIRMGAKSVIVLPLVVEGRTFGVLTLYAPERDFFDAEEVKLLSGLAGDISFGLEFILKGEKVDYLAYYDALTGLANRTLLADRLGHSLKAAARGRSMTALVLMDVERFHVINETFGRAIADDVLRELARRLQRVVRAEESLARVAGDRFALTLAGIGDMNEAVHFLRDRIVPVLADPIGVAGQELRLSARFGITLHPADGGDPETLYAHAETALKKAKAGGERMLFYAPEMNARVAETLTLENKLRNALDQGHFVLHYQPKINAADRRILGFEALIRWRDPELGLIAPAKFIPLMEETGMILDAGRWAMRQVGRDCLLWAGQGITPPRIALNVSPIQLRQDDFVGMVAEAAGRVKESGSALDLEITESVIMANVDDNVRKLIAIRDLGVHISVDDFGTGYSSLAYITRLPIHELKIDRSFVAGMTEMNGSLSVVNSVISLAHSMNLQVVAEGVETEAQAAQLAGLGCDQLQGYLYSPPVPPEEVPALIATLS